MSAPTHTLLYLQAVVSADGQAAFLPCEVVHTAPESGSPSTGAYTFALHDAAGKLLDSRHVDPGIRCGPKEKAAHILSTHLRLRAEAHSATLSRAGKRLAVLALQKKPPQVAFVKTPAKGTVVKGRQTIA